MKILIAKAKIALVIIIAFQIYGYLNGQNISALPGIDGAQTQSGYALTRSAHANDFGGIPVDVPFNPYAGSSTSDLGQMKAMAKSQAMQIMDSGNIGQIKREMEAKGLIPKGMSLSDIKF